VDLEQDLRFDRTSVKKRLLQRSISGLGRLETRRLAFWLMSLTS
jgi:hypothetical protein